MIAEFIGFKAEILLNGITESFFIKFLVMSYMNTEFSDFFLALVGFFMFCYHYSVTDQKPPPLIFTSQYEKFCAAPKLKMKAFSLS